MANLDKAKVKAKSIGQCIGRAAIGSISKLEPGDATRYELALTRTDDEGLIFAWLNAQGGGKAMRIPSHMDAPHPDYIAEKMGIRAEYEAEIFAAFLDGVLS